MFTYLRDGYEEEDFVCADEVVYRVTNTNKSYDITEIIRLLEKLSPNSEVIYYGLNSIYIYFSRDEYVRFGIKREHLNMISGYITQVQVSIDPNWINDVFFAPNLQVIAFKKIKYNELKTDEGLHVVFGGKYDTAFLNNIPSMAKVTITAGLDPRYIPEIVAKLPDWPSLKIVRIKDHRLDGTAILEGLRAYTRLRGIELQYE